MRSTCFKYCKPIERCIIYEIFGKGVGSLVLEEGVGNSLNTGSHYAPPLTIHQIQQATCKVLCFIN